MPSTSRGTILVRLESLRPWAPGRLQKIELKSLRLQPIRGGMISDRRRQRSGGNALLETAFTIVPVFALICAFADFGLVLFRWSTMQNAIREGCRYAITF